MFCFLEITNIQNVNSKKQNLNLLIIESNIPFTPIFVQLEQDWHEIIPMGCSHKDSYRALAQLRVFNAS
jgi:hypothetical protein